MATTDTDVSQLVINKLTKAQYDGITTPSDTELYFVDDGKTYVTTDMLATVATSGAYSDLSGTPTLSTVATTGAYSDLSGTPTLSSVATSGSYNDLTDKPTIPTVNNATLTIQKNSTNVATFTANAASNVTANISVPTATSDLNNDSGFLTSIPTASASTLGGIKVGSGLSISNGVLSTQSTAPDWSDITNKPNFATVATSGSYNDLSNKPTIPAAQVNSDWDAVSGVAQILNKPSLAAVATSGAYSDLSGTPSLATVATSGSYSDLSNKPSIPAAQVQSDWTQATNTAVDYIKNKPNLATVATSGSYNDLSNKPTIPTVNNATLTIQKNGTTVKTFTANASSDVTANITVPTKTSDLNNDSNFVVSTALAAVATSGSYNDLSNKPTIPAAQVNSDWDAVSGVAQILNKPSLATVATSGSYNDLSNKPTIPTVNNATLTIQKNGTTVNTFTANASSNVTANITVPTTVAELSDAGNYATNTALDDKQDVLTAGDHISISNDTISATGYVHSENPVTAASSTATVTGSMIANGTITADKLASGATVKLTLSTTDIGEGAALAANTLYGVYQ